jgi:CheY-like chemotaxis protein
MLKRLGYPIDVAGNGQEAVDAVSRAQYALIFMDCQMPVMDGFQATREIRTFVPQQKQPRIIAITAHVMDGYREQCLSAGMDDYMSKPVGRRELEETITRHLAIHLFPTPAEMS